MAQDVIIRGVTYQGVDKLSLPVLGGSALFRDTSDGDAVAGEIMNGKKAYNANGAVNGSMVNQGAVSGTISDKDTPYTIPAGYHNGSGTVDIASAQKALLLPGNIRNGVTILGVTGTYSGGGGGPTASDAILTVIVPTGSNVTATKGGVMLLPTIWTTAQDVSKDCALFIIPSSLFDSQNSWTVTATRGADSAADTIIIDSAYKYDVLLKYNNYLYRNGTEYVNISESTSGRGVATEESQYVLLEVPRGEHTARMYPQNKINLTGYSAAVCVVEVTAISGSPNGSLGLRSSPTGTLSSSASIPNTIGTHTVTLDVSSVNAEWYVTIALGGGNGSATYHVTELYLVEK